MVIALSRNHMVEMSSIEALNKLTERYLKTGKVLHIKHLSSDCRWLIKNADSVVDVDVNVIKDPEYVVKE